MQSFTIKEVLLQKEASNHGLTKKILDKLPSVHIRKYIGDEPETAPSKKKGDDG